jgi:hypothetical protein
MQLVEIKTSGNSITIEPKYCVGEEVGCTGVCWFSQFEPYYQVSCNKNFSSVHYEEEVFVLCEDKGTCVNSHRDSPKPEIQHYAEPLVDEDTKIRNAEFMGVIGFPVISCPDCPNDKVCWVGDPLHDDVTMCVYLHSIKVRNDCDDFNWCEQIIKAVCTYPNVCNHTLQTLVHGDGAGTKSSFNNLIK